jgi:hypothetical protein
MVGRKGAQGAPKYARARVLPGFISAFTISAFRFCHPALFFCIGLADFQSFSAIFQGHEF